MTVKGIIFFHACQHQSGRLIYLPKRAISALGLIYFVLTYSKRKLVLL